MTYKRFILISNGFRTGYKTGSERVPNGSKRVRTGSERFRTGSERSLNNNMEWARFGSSEKIGRKK